MTISADFSINGASIASGLATVSPSSVVTLAVLNLSGVTSIQWSCVGTHEAATTPASITALITPAGVPSGATATFTFPAGVTGQSYRIKCQIIGVDNRTYTSFGIVGSTNAGGRIPFAAGEELERHLTQGWTDAMNALVGYTIPVTLPANPGDDGEIAYAGTGNLLYANGVKISGGVALTLGTGTLPASGALRLDAASEIWARGSSADLRVFKVDAGTNDVTLGQDASLGSITYRVSTSHIWNIGGSTYASLFSTGLFLVPPLIRFADTTVGPALLQATTGGATGQVFLVQAQNAATTGGALDLRSGTGATAPGNVTFRCGANIALFGNYNSATAGCFVSIGSAVSTGVASVSVGDGRTNDGISLLQFAASSGVSDSLRIIRNGGVNGTSLIIHRGTGGLELRTVNAGNILIVHNSVTKCFFDDTGFRPDSDGGYSIGAGNTRFNEGHFSSFIAIGTDPADTGAIRLANNGGIYWESNPTGADIPGIVVSTDNIVYIGGPTQNPNVILDSTTSLIVRVAGAAQLTLSATLADFGDNEIRTTGHLSVGTTGVASGAIRIGNNLAIMSEESGGTDRRLAHITSGNIMAFGDPSIAVVGYWGGSAGGSLTAADGTPRIAWNNTGVSFQNVATPIAKPAVTGSRGGNAALASLLTALANYGLVTDSSS